MRPYNTAKIIPCRIARGKLKFGHPADRPYLLCFFYEDQFSHNFLNGLIWIFRVDGGGLFLVLDPRSLDNPP